jgi:hypothetical protein
MNKNRIQGVSVGRVGNVPRSPYSIKDATRRFGDCAWKATELAPGDLSCVAAAMREPKGNLTAGQKSAEGVVDHAVGEASEALQYRKVESTDRPSRER